MAKESNSGVILLNFGECTEQKQWVFHEHVSCEQGTEGATYRRTTESPQNYSLLQADFKLITDKLINTIA